MISRNVNFAESFVARLRGLMGRSHLAADQSLYLVGTNGVHMLFMRFPIDCIFLGEAQRDGSRPIVALRHRLLPWRSVVWYVRGAKGAVELPAGTLDEADLRVGDLVRFELATS